MKVLGILYGQYLSTHGRQAPRGEQDFLEYISREPANWQQLAPTASAFLRSPRNGVPLTIAYGRLTEPPGGGLPWVAYESTAIDGQRLAVNVRGVVQLMDEQSFQSQVTATAGGGE